MGQGGLSGVASLPCPLTPFFFHGLCGFAFGVFFLFRGALVVELFAFGKTDGQFDAPALVMQINWHDGVACALHLVDDFFDFCGVQQQFAGAYRIGMDVRRGVQQGADMRAEQVERAILGGDVGFLELRASGADGLDFPAFQHDAGLVFVFDEVFVKRFFILDNAHGR